MSKIISILKRKLYWVKYLVNGNYHYFLNLLKVKKNKIVVTNYYGKGFGDNGKYIIESLLKISADVDVVWLVDKDIDTSNFPDRVRCVRYKTFDALREMSTASVWLDNSRKYFYPPKRKNQMYIQTWHSPLRLKKIEKDAFSHLGEAYIKSAKRDAAMTDLMISGSDFSTNIYRNSFWYDGEILECGTPRCDVFFEDNRETIRNVKNNLNISEGTNVVLFAPTFRQSGIDEYVLDFDSILEQLETKTSKKWKFLLRLHPNVMKESKKIALSDNVINVSSYPDMQELIIISDLLLTDYSSSMFDALISNTPCFIIARDYDSYLKKERELYFDLDELPFVVSYNDTELLSNIERFNKENYEKKTEKFKEKINLKENGQASLILANRIVSFMNGEK